MNREFRDYLDALSPPRDLRRGFGALGLETSVSWNDWAHQPEHEDAAPLASAVDAVERATTALRTEFLRRIAPATVAFQGEYRIMQMPAGPSGQCPALGALDYVYPDLFAAAQINLKRLADDAPRRGAPGALVRRWVTLIRWNIHLLYHASNIRHRFLFPTDTDPANTSPDFDFRGTDQRTKRTLAPGATGADSFGYKNGAPVGGAELLGEIRGGPQAVTDLVHRLIGPRGLDDQFLFAGTLRPEIKLDKSYTNALGKYVRPDGSTYDGHLTSSQIVQREADGRRYDSALAAAWRAPLSSMQALRYIEIWRETARIYSEVRLDAMLVESLGFYVFNHNVYWMAQLGLSPEQVANAQRAASQAALSSHPATGAITMATTAVVSAINPIIAVIYAILTTIAIELLRPFLLNNIEYAAPYSLFVRVPHPGCVQLTPEATAEEMVRRAAANRTDAVGLPVAPPPGPIMLTPQQRATLFELQRRGALSPSQQALIARPLVLVSPTPAPATKSGLVPLGIGAALLALFFSRR